MTHRWRAAARDPRDDDAGALQHLDPLAVERRVGLELVAVVVDIDAAIGQHAVHVAGEKAHAGGEGSEFAVHHTTLARNRSCMCTAPTSRRSASTTSSCITLGGDSIR